MELSALFVGRSIQINVHDMIDRSIIKKNFFSIILISSIYFLDRASKLLMINLANNAPEFNFKLSSFLNLNLIWNEGIAFGLFSFNKEIYYNFLTFVIILITAVLVWFMVKSKGLEKIGFSIIIGGSIGNFSDRIYYSSVPDFIDFNFKGFHWFVFNVADIFITLGVIILIYFEIFSKKQQ